PFSFCDIRDVYNFPRILLVGKALTLEDYFSGFSLKDRYLFLRRFILFNDHEAEKIKRKQIDFDIVFCSSDDMNLLKPLASILGPRGLMPNKNVGTVFNDFKSFSKIISLFLYNKLL